MCMCVYVCVCVCVYICIYKYADSYKFIQDPDPGSDPKLPEKSDPDHGSDPKKIIPDPQHWLKAMQICTRTSDGITYVGSTWLIAFVRRRDECDSRRGEPWGRQEVPLTRHQVLLAFRKTQLLPFLLSWSLPISTFRVADPTIHHRPHQDWI
jgi:hypothetical protein